MLSLGSLGLHQLKLQIQKKQLEYYQLYSIAFVTQLRLFQIEAQHLFPQNLLLVLKLIILNII